MTAYVLNLADLGCTLWSLRLGCQELNPLMRCIPFQAFYKVVMVGLLCWWLSLRQEQIARVGLNLCTAVYAATCVYHFYYLFLIRGF